MSWVFVSPSSFERRVVSVAAAYWKRRQRLVGATHLGGDHQLTAELSPGAGHSAQGRPCVPSQHCKKPTRALSGTSKFAYLNRIGSQEQI